MARILIVGSGVVGQATGKGLAKKGHEVTFVDTNIEIVRKLRQEGFEVCLPNELDDVSAEISMFCVSTLARDDGSVNLNCITGAIANYGKWLRHKREREDSWNLVVVRSTVPPGTTRKILLPLLEKSSGRIVGKDFGLCMQPEFLRAKSAEKDFRHPWATVIGEWDRHSGEVLAEIYADFGSKIFRVDLETAEFVKYVHNCFNATKISFSNEMWQLGSKLGIDANSALEIAVNTAEGYWNPAYGTVGGQPYGGACLPKDTKGLEAFAKKIGVSMPLLSAVISVNSEMEELATQGVVPPATIVGHKWQPLPNLVTKERTRRK
jgi:UDPglucose 6-dehydrogenase